MSTNRKINELMSKVARIGYWSLDLVTNDLLWSDIVYEIHGLSKETFTPNVKDEINFYIPEHRETITNAIEAAIASGKGWDLELQIWNEKDQKPIWVRAVGEVEFEEGNPVRFYGTFQDIDKVKTDEIALKKSQTKLNLALETAGIGNWNYFPLEGKVLWDKNCYDLFGKNFTSKVKSFEDWVNCIIPTDQAKVRDQIYECLKKKEKKVETIFRIRHPDKGIRNIRCRSIVLYDNENLVQEVVGLNWDITEEIQFQETLMKARQDALDATQAKSSFLASMSHEIRTPMNGMMGMLELLEDTPLNEEQRDLIETIQLSGDQLLHVVNDILDFSKIEAGKMNFEYRPFDPRKVIKGVLAIFHAQVERKGIALESNISEDIPDYLYGDETRLKQVLTNLISNAIKFTDEGGVTLSLIKDNRLSSEKHGTFMFQIKDTGLGIPLEKQGRLFESFRQVDETTTRKFGGTGLGLAICRSIVEKMGGHIGVESSEGEGSNFFFDFMAGIGHKEEEEEEVKEVVTGVTYQRDLKILIVEDNKTNQKLALNFIKKMGIQRKPDVAENGQVAVTYCIEGREYDLILMDVQMPVMDGLTATVEIKRILGEKCPPICAMTANAFEEDRKDCMAAGMDYFIPKPIKRKNISEMLIDAFPIKSFQIVKNEEEDKDNPMSDFTYISTDKILFEFSEDFEIFEELIADYKDQVESFYGELLQSEESKDAEKLKITGHTLKGIVANFYAESLRDAAYNLEVSGSTQDFTKVLAQIEAFKRINDKVLEELDKFIKDCHSGVYKVA